MLDMSYLEAQNDDPYSQKVWERLNKQASKERFKKNTKDKHGQFFSNGVSSFVERKSSLRIGWIPLG